MASADNQGYVKRAIAGSLAMLMASSAALAESKFLSLMLSFAISRSLNISLSLRIDNLFAGITIPNEMGRLAVVMDQCVERILGSRTPILVIGQKCSPSARMSVHVGSEYAKVPV